MGGNQAYDLLVPAYFDVPWLYLFVSSPGNQFPSSHSVIGFQCSASTRSVHRTPYLKTPSVNLLTTSLDTPLAASLVHHVRTLPQHPLTCMSTPLMMHCLSRATRKSLQAPLTTTWQSQPLY
ncbi:hypothetical protein ILYODFUR_025499 [Ilyodon furcidens]|uniref:Uncharacterized protein n=1 Tax=Ilyodon furcidens TaxID=33524 RepID=A0ABV0V8X4_9TELE